MGGADRFCVFKKLKGLEDWALQQWRDFYIGGNFLPLERMNAFVQNVQGRGKKVYAAKRVAAFYKRLTGKLDVSCPSSFSRVGILSNNMLDFVSALSDQPRLQAEIAFRLVRFTRKSAAAMASEIKEANAIFVMDNILQNLNCLVLLLESNPALQLRVARWIPGISGPQAPAVTALQREYKRLRKKGDFNTECLNAPEKYVDRLAGVLSSVMLRRQPETREYKFSKEPTLENGVKILFRRTGRVTIQGKRGLQNVHTVTGSQPVPVSKSVPTFATVLWKLAA